MSDIKETKYPKEYLQNIELIRYRIPNKTWFYAENMNPNIVFYIDGKDLFNGDKTDPLKLVFRCNPENSIRTTSDLVIAKLIKLT